MDNRDKQIATILGVYRRFAVKAKHPTNGLRMLQICHELMGLGSDSLDRLYRDYKVVAHKQAEKSEYEIRIEVDPL